MGEKTRKWSSHRDNVILPPEKERDHYETGFTDNSGQFKKRKDGSEVKYSAKGAAVGRVGLSEKLLNFCLPQTKKGRNHLKLLMIETAVNCITSPSMHMVPGGPLSMDFFGGSMTPAGAMIPKGQWDWAAMGRQRVSTCKSFVSEGFSEICEFLLLGNKPNDLKITGNTMS